MTRAELLHDGDDEIMDLAAGADNSGAESTILPMGRYAVHCAFFVGSSKKADDGATGPTVGSTVFRRRNVA